MAIRYVTDMFGNTSNIHDYRLGGNDFNTTFGISVDWTGSPVFYLLNDIDSYTALTLTDNHEQFANGTNLASSIVLPYDLNLPSRWSIKEESTYTVPSGYNHYFSCPFPYNLMLGQGVSDHRLDEDKCRLAGGKRVILCAQVREGGYELFADCTSHRNTENLASWFTISGFYATYDYLQNLATLHLNFWVNQSSSHYQPVFYKRFPLY